MSGGLRMARAGGKRADEDSPFRVVLAGGRCGGGAVMKRLLICKEPCWAVSSPRASPAVISMARSAANGALAFGRC